MTIGEVLSARRGERGLTIEQAAAATLIRPDRLRALESDDIASFAAPVYARGSLRTYAGFLGLDAEQLVADIGTDDAPGLAIEVGARSSRPRFVFTTQALAAAGLLLLVGAFGGYAWRQMTADQKTLVLAPSAQTAAAPGATTSASPAIQARPIVVGVRVTDTVWINAVIDGTPLYGSVGRTLPAGSVVYFTGVDVKLTSGKASATYITVDGRSLGPMGTGVATRDFSSQTSP